MAVRQWRSYPRFVDDGRGVATRRCSSQRPSVVRVLQPGCVQGRFGANGILCRHAHDQVTSLAHEFALHEIRIVGSPCPCELRPRTTRTCGREPELCVRLHDRRALRRRAAVATSATRGLAFVLDGNGSNTCHGHQSRARTAADTIHTASIRGASHRASASLPAPRECRSVLDRRSRNCLGACASSLFHACGESNERGHNTSSNNELK
jgi:hypothetical protein